MHEDCTKVVSKLLELGAIKYSVDLSLELSESVIDV